MPQIIKPSNLSLTWASGGDVLNPGDTKYATGWQVEIPPRQWFNYLDNRQDTAIAHINQHGVVVWDNATEYQEDKSYVQGPTNGTIYRSVQTNVNQNPETDLTNTYWIVAFAGAGDFYTKAEADGTFLSKSSNGSDIPNTATFRSNISVYSQAQTYTKTEVDAKTTIASTAQSQTWVSNTTLLTPLRLAEAFQGVNSSLTGNGYQKIPGGLIIQWGDTGSIAGGASSTVTLPVTFPTTCVSVTTTLGTVSNSTTPSGSGSQIVSNSQITFRNLGVANFAIRWIAIGY